MIGSITTTNENLMKSAAEGIERRFIFIGDGTKNQDQVIMITQDSDLLDLIGEGKLYDQVQAFSDNVLAGGAFLGAVYPVDAKTQSEIIDDVLASGFIPEIFIFSDIVTSQAEIETLQVAMNALEAKGIFAFSMVSLPGIDKDTQTWAEYQTAMNDIVKDAVAENVVAVPLLNGNNIGVLAGRLCREDLSVADTPIRTKTGPVLSLGSMPIDKNDVRYSNAEASALNIIRLSVPQKYPSKAGVYWSDATTLDTTVGDYKVTDVLRPVLKAMRKVHARMFPRLGDRTLSDTKVSIKAGENYAAKPLREMAETTTRGEEILPGDIYPPKAGDVNITFVSDEQITVSVGVRPIKSAKKIINKLYVISEG